MTYRLCLVPLTLLMATGALLMPLWWQGGSQGHDLFHHLLSGHYFAAQLWQGEPYPRWLMAMNGGFGSPTFFFYPPLPYYVSALFAGPDLAPHRAIYPLLASATLALFLSGLFAYLWLCRLTSCGRALAVSLLYLALPYHLAIDLYARFALAEFWAFVWAPLALLGQELICRNRPMGPTLLALAVALLALSHLPSLLLTLGLITLLGLLHARQTAALGALWQSLSAQMLGMGMAAMLLFPALLDQGAISMELMRGGIFDFRRNFLDRLPSGWHDWYFRGQLAWLTILTLGLLLLAWAGAADPRRTSLQCWGVVGVLAFLMMLPVSQPLWWLLPPLQQVQFPWRCNLILTLATLAVVALATPAPGLWRYGWWGLLLLTLASSLAYVKHAPLTQAPDKTVLDAEFDSKRSAREYRPSQVPKGEFTPTRLAWKEEFQPPIVTQQADVQWQVRHWQARHLELEVTAKAPARLLLHQYDYPGWQAWLDDSLPLAVSANHQGLIQVWVPAGHHRLTLRLAPRWPELAGYGVSLLAWLFWLYLSYRALVHARPISEGG
jgi:hypothetical protein